MDNFLHHIVSTHGIDYLMSIVNLIPEIMVAGSAIILLLGGVYGGTKSTSKMHALAIFVLVALLALMLVPDITYGRHVMFSHMFINDAYSHFVKILLVAAAALTLLLSAQWLDREENRQFEFPVLVLIALLGMLLMVSANDLLSLYVGLELSSLPLYVLASFSRDSLKSTEAGLKYFVLGALASGMLLFGASMVYGFAGTTSFEGLAHLFHDNKVVDSGVVIGMVLIIVGFCFKVSAAPFHMWAPDVYEGAPTPVTAYLSTASKVAAVALFVRVLAQPFGELISQWQQVVVVVSIASMVIGAFGALAQTNIKRLLAYSSIGHVGYALIGLAAGGVDGISGVLVYLALYVAMSAGAFACVLMMSRGGEPTEEIRDLAGLSRTKPGMAFALAAFMFSMAGIPPFAGFFGKMYVFLAAMHAGLNVLAVIGVLMSVVACFYYLKIVKIMYFEEPGVPLDNAAPYSLRVVLIVCVAVVGLYFVMPAPLVAEARIAAEGLLQ